MSGHLRVYYAAFTLIAGLSTSSAFSTPLSELFNAGPATAPAPASAEAECLTRPGKSTADGQHWVYRVVGQRRCWFQIAEGTERAKKLVQQRATKHRVAAAEENQTAARKRKTAVDARAELPRSAPADTSRPSPSVPAQVVDASPVLATGIATRASPAPLSKRDRLTADEITPRQVDVEALLAAAPAASDVVAASAAPLASSAAEAGDDGRVWTWLGMLLMALGLISVLSASPTIRWAALLPQLSFACLRRVGRQQAEWASSSLAARLPGLGPTGLMGQCLASLNTTAFSTDRGECLKASLVEGEFSREISCVRSIASRRAPCLFGNNPVSQTIDRAKSVGGVGSDRWMEALHHLRKRVSWTEVQDLIDPELYESLQRRRPVDRARDLACELCCRIGHGEDALAAIPGEEGPLVCDMSASAGRKRLLQGRTGRFETPRMRGDFDGEETGAGGTLGRRLLTEVDDIALRASNHDKKVGIPDCDLAAVRPEQVVERSSFEPADVAEPPVRARHVVHQSGANIGQS
ncbi:hypothetical protein ACVIU4_002775 [Bradyrhizobium barranii subsp. barranii]|nr:hypothetical protein [Bradyrhizobium japonicum]MCP1965688.1 hypothetical protein [Bradyrhizobium japonicum]